MANDILTLTYRQLDAEAARFADRLRSNRDFEHRSFVPVKEEKELLSRSLVDIQKRIITLEAPDPVYGIIRQQMLNFLDGQAGGIDSAFERPSRYIGQWTQVVTYLSRKDSRPAAERAALLLERLPQANAVWSGVQSWLGDAPAVYLQEAVDSCQILEDTLAKELDRFPESLVEAGGDTVYRVQEAVRQLIALSLTWKEELRALLQEKGVPSKGMTADDECIPFAEDYYRNLLTNELGVDLDQLLSWYEAEVEKTRAEVFAIASRLQINDPMSTMSEINDILLKYAGPKSNPEEMFRYGREYLARAKAGCRDYVWLPDDEQCIVAPVPEQIKFSYPWGGYGGGCPRRRPLIGEYFINDFNYTAVTDGWLKMMAIHESYPGHHVQFIRGTLDTLPETVKMGSRSVPITEGTAHRSERVFEFVFAEDPFYPLFVAYRRHHTSVRIKVELTLRYFGRPIGDGVKIYMDELGFDYHTARGQVRAQETMQGYFNCYYYGMKRIADLEQSFPFDSKQFTELLFSAGRIGLDLFEEYLKLKPDDRQRYHKDFASLLQ